MAVRSEWVRYGRPAAEALRRAVSDAKGSDPLAPVTVVVPTNHVGVAARRLLASGRVGPICPRGSGLAAVTFLTTYRLGELLGAPALSREWRRPVSTPVVAAALRASLLASPGIFEPVASHPSTEMGLVASYRELRDVSAEALDALARQSRRAGDVVRLCRDARNRLAPSWYDEEDLLDAAASVLVAEPGRAAELGSVVVYLPERVTRHGAALLRRLAEHREILVLAGCTGDGKPDAEVARSLRRIDDDAGDDDPPVTDPLSVVERGRTRILTASDADEEVRAAVRAVMDAVRAGTPLDRIAVLFAEPLPYARLAFEQLAAAGIAVNGTAVTSLAAQVPARTLLGLLALPEGGFRREDVFAWLAGARLRHRGRWAPVAAWERLSRDAGVVAGRDDWDRRLARLAGERDAEAELAVADPDAPPWRVERARTAAERTRQLRSFVLELVDDLAAAARATHSWPRRAEWARRHLARLLGDPIRGDWPVTEVRAAERVDRALDRLACLGEIETAVTLDVFRRTLELELEADLGRVGRMGEGVLVGPVSMGVGLDLDLVVVLGLAEGSFPTPAQDDSLLPDREREATGDQLPRRAARVERQHRDLLAALAAAPRQLLCLPRGDLRHSQERVPSRWVLDIASRLAGERWWSEDLLRTEAGTGWLEHVASFDAGLRRSVFPASAQEYRLRYLLAHGARLEHDGPWGELRDLALSGGAEVARSRRSRAFTRFDGNLAGLPVPSPAARPTSATRLEGWAKCPFAYLLHDLLGVEPVENPEDQLAISPLDRGSLIHDILEHFILEVLARPVVQQPGPGEPFTAADRARLMRIAEDKCAEYEDRGLTGRAVFWKRERRRLLDDLTRLLDADDAHRAAHRTRPVAAELAFGLPGSALGLVAMELPDGRSVEFRGKADRVDVGEDGTIHVVDYKTGASKDYKGLSEEDPDLGGRRLQLPVYGQAARALQGDREAPVVAEYWFATTKGRFDRVGYRVTSEVLEHFGDTLQAMVEGIEAGVFPPYPTASSTSVFVDCPYCEPDGLGVSDLLRGWERKREDPALAGFVALVEAVEEGADDVAD